GPAVHRPVGKVRPMEQSMARLAVPVPLRKARAVGRAHAVAQSLGDGHSPCRCATPSRWAQPMPLRKARTAGSAPAPAEVAGPALPPVRTFFPLVLVGGTESRFRFHRRKFDRSDVWFDR